MRSPSEFFTHKPGTLVLVVGATRSGRSALIRSLAPAFQDQYLPEFVNQRKDVFGRLLYLTKDSVIAIKTNLPNLHDSSDGFLMELKMTANMRKHSYLLEWGTSGLENPENIVSATYIKYVDTIYLTMGCEDLGDIPPDSSDPRFATIDDYVDSPVERTSLQIRYKVVYHLGSKSIGNPEYTFRMPWRK